MQLWQTCLLFAAAEAHSMSHSCPSRQARQILRVVKARELGYHVWIVAERGAVRISTEVGGATVADYEPPVRKWFRRSRCHDGSDVVTREKPHNNKAAT